MGLIRGLIERRSGFSSSDTLPDNHWFWRWTGGTETSAGVAVNETVATNSLLVMACVRILAETVASLPLPVYRRLDRGRDVARTHSLYPVLHDESNPEMSSFIWRERMMAHLALWGNHYSVIDRSNGDVVALTPFHPRRVTPYRDGRELRYRIDDGSTYDYPARDILHVPGLAMDGLVGLPPLRQMAEALGISRAGEQAAGRIFANDLRPSVLLTHPGSLSDTARSNLRDSWTELHGGGKGGVGILEEGMKFEALAMPPEDAELLETRKFQVQEFARFYRIPPHLLADVERSTSWGSGIEQQNIGFVVYTMRPWLVRIEQEMNRRLIPEFERKTYYVEFNVDGMLRGDLSTRTSSYATARQWGWMSANDIRSLENQQPIDGGDVYLQPLNMIDATLGNRSEDLPADDDRSRAGRETRAARQMRSATARRRLANAHIATYRDVAARMVRIQQTDVRAAVRRHLRERSVESFSAWIREYYYEKHPARVERDWLGPVRTLVESIAAEAADEVDGEMPSDDDMDTWARDYVATLALRHCGDARSRLLALVNADDERAARDADSLADAIDDEVDSWDAWPDEVAHEEAHRSSNATARWAFALLGVLTLRWVAFGSEPCDYCQAMAGRTVSTGGAFLAAGAEFAPAGIAPLISRSSIGHPPLHPHCECQIVAG